MYVQYDVIYHILCPTADGVPIKPALFDWPSLFTLFREV